MNKQSNYPQFDKKTSTSSSSTATTVHRKQGSNGTAVYFPTLLEWSGVFVDKMYCLCANESQVIDDVQKTQYHTQISSAFSPVKSKSISTTSTSTTHHRDVTVYKQKRTVEPISTDKVSSALSSSSSFQKNPSMASPCAAAVNAVPLGGGCADVSSRNSFDSLFATHCYKFEGDDDDSIRLPPPVSHADTYTTVSMSESLQDDYDYEPEEEDDDEAWSTVSTQLVSHCFRKHAADFHSKTSTALKVSNNNSGMHNNHKRKKVVDEQDDDDADHEAYRYLLRMKTENYVHEDDDEDDDDENVGGLSYLQPIYRSDFLSVVSECRDQ